VYMRKSEREREGVCVRDCICVFVCVGGGIYVFACVCVLRTPVPTASLAGIASETLLCVCVYV